MNRYYGDILDLTRERPKWWDENGVPRFVPFAPTLLDIYANEAVLLEIKCQGCRVTYMVAMSLHTFDREEDDLSLAEHIQGGSLTYGDPPNNRCCPVGPTMNSIPVRVHQYWEFDLKTPKEHGFARRKELEIVLKRKVQEG